MEEYFASFWIHRKAVSLYTMPNILTLVNKPLQGQLPIAKVIGDASEVLVIVTKLSAYFGDPGRFLAKQLGMIFASECHSLAKIVASG